MRLIDSHHKFRFPILVLFFFLGASAGAPRGVLFAERADFRTNANPLDLGTTVRGEGFEAGEPDCFRAEVPGAGYLLLEVAVPGGAEAEPRLGLLPPGRDELRVIARSAKFVLAKSRSALRIELCVGAQDPALRLGEYRLESRFAGLGAADSEEGPLIEVDPEGLLATLGPGMGFPADAELIEVDPEGLLATLGPGMGFPADAELIEVDPEGARATPLAALCGAADDHGDTFLCSTPLALGRAVSGEIANIWGDDYDVFAFAVTAERTVRVRTAGELDASAGLYDRNGQRLAAAEGREIRLVRTLAPGLYFLRIEGRQRAEGDYALTVDRLPQPW